MAYIGVLKEYENNESRVALNNYTVTALKNMGHKVYITSNAGLKSGISNKKYEDAGGAILSNNKEVIEQSDIIMKISKPSDEELSFFKPNQVLFCFLNLISDPESAIKLANAKITAIGYETIKNNNSYPILEPMSKLVGKMCYSIAAGLLSMPGKGKGIFLGGSAGTSRSKVVIFGGGHAGKELMKIANNAGSRVTVFDKDLSVMKDINDYNPQIQTMYPHHDLIIREIKNADLVVGAAFSGTTLVNKILSKEIIKMMEPKSVFIDLTTQSGGMSSATSFDPTRKNDIFQKHNVIHYCVPNIAATIPKTATSALADPILNYLVRYLLTAHENIHDDIIDNAIQVKNGEIADFIKIDSDTEKTEYDNKIKNLINENDDFDLLSMFEDDKPQFEKDVFELKVNDKSENKKTNVANKEKRNEISDDPFADSNFDDFDLT